jgi:hypothetical protein
MMLDYNKLFGNYNLNKYDGDKTGDILNFLELRF